MSAPAELPPELLEAFRHFITPQDIEAEVLAALPAYDARRRAEWEAERQPAADMGAALEMGGCPCTLVEPCRSTCSCANPIKSGGCSHCARYGSDEQRLASARNIAEKLARGDDLFEKLDEWRAEDTLEDVEYARSLRAEPAEPAPELRVDARRRLGLAAAEPAELPEGLLSLLERFQAHLFVERAHEKGVFCLLCGVCGDHEADCAWAEFVARLSRFRWQSAAPEGLADDLKPLIDRAYQLGYQDGEARDAPSVPAPAEGWNHLLKTWRPTVLAAISRYRWRSAAEELRLREALTNAKNQWAERAFGSPRRCKTCGGPSHLRETDCPFALLFSQPSPDAEALAKLARLPGELRSQGEGKPTDRAIGLDDAADQLAALLRRAGLEPKDTP